METERQRFERYKAELRAKRKGAPRNGLRAYLAQYGEIDVLIGIDPGRKTGLAMYSRKAKLLAELKTLDFWGLYVFLRSLAAQGKARNILFVVEDPNDNKPLFGKGITINPRLSPPELMKRVRMREKMAQNVGSNKREASLILEALERLGLRYYARPPRQGGKMDAQGFKQLTGWQARTNEHVRDAAMLVFGY